MAVTARHDYSGVAEVMWLELVSDLNVQKSCSKARLIYKDILPLHEVIKGNLLEMHRKFGFYLLPTVLEQM